MLIIMKKDEKTWPGYHRWQRVTELPVGVNSMEPEHWERKVKHVGKDRIEAAINRGDLVIQGDKPKPKPQPRRSGGDS